MTRLQAHQAAQAASFIVIWTASPPHHTTHWTERWGLLWWRRQMLFD